MSYKEMSAIATRHLALGALFFLPLSSRIALERRLRGKEEYRKLQEADWVLMSWGKSGRTWFRVMLSHFYKVKFGLPDNRMLEFDNFHKLDSRIPRVLFSHNNYMRDYLQNWDNLNHFQGKKVVLLVRDPRDVAVSQYFQWRYRMLPRKKLLNDYPPHGAEVDTFNFACNPNCGIPRIVEYFNGWADAMAMMGDNLLLIRYEDMRKDPHAVMKQVFEFTGTPGDDSQVDAAVQYAAYDNMKKLEEKKSIQSSGQRVKPGDKSNPDSFKVRRGKVGGYRDYFDDEQLTRIDAMVEEHLNPVYGYTKNENAG
jgi:hypothetical protein